MPEYHAEPWKVRGKLFRILSTTKFATRASKPNRIITNTARLLKIRKPTKATGSNWLPAAPKTVIKRTHATAAAHSLRSKARRRNRTNRNASQIKGPQSTVRARSAMIVRAPRNCHSGPEDGSGGG